MPNPAIIKARSKIPPGEPNNAAAKPKRPTKPASKPAIHPGQSAAPKRRCNGGNIDSEDDAAPVSKKGRVEQQGGKAKKTGTQKTPPPPPVYDKEDDTEEGVSEDDGTDEGNTEGGGTEEDVDDDIGSIAGGQGRKVKRGGDGTIPMQMGIRATCRQKCYKVLQQITSDDSELPAKRKTDMEECIKILSDAHTWGKLMPRAIDLWVEPEDVLLDGFEHIVSSEGTSENDSNLKAFNTLTSYWSLDLSKDLDYFVNADDGVSKISMALHKGFRCARQEDTHKICDSILKIIVKDPRKESVPFPIPMIKSAQGFSYIETARLLCPQTNLEMFNYDTEWRQQLCEGKIKVSYWELPSFLFDQSKVLPKDDLAGCMEGFVLVRTVKHLLTSDGIPSKLKGPTRPSIVKMYKIKKMTGRLIAYGACQAHYALSSLDSWRCRDGKFDLQKFYSSIVDMYEDIPDDPWAVASLAWWNKEVFGSLNDDDDDSPPPESTVFKMAEACRQ
ncbi:hypothetical protein IW261DRAFT_1666963 [Armillaria novae-zelandiae]|uniref:Uncharacterized protein n=1 Tax=Armillaria novae-zelandiae TaxID=153914 RepID=A0AA39T8H5_9AGAR|nr:hypothetical protein IW261DRAFT_1666963 [Armillaria novae-zelandiae]